MTSTANWAACALVAVLAASLSLSSPNIEADTVTLVEGTRTAQRCIEQQIRPCPAISAYSLQQTIVAAAATWNGWPVERTTRLLAALSGLSVGLLAILTVTRLSSQHRATGLAVVAAGPLLYYARSSFGEALACLALAWFIVVIVRDHEPRAAQLTGIGIAALWASLGKDTMPLFVVLFGLAAVWLDDRRPRGGWPRVCATVVGASAGAAAFAGFHRFRLGTFYNAEYVDHPEFFLSSPLDVSSAFLGHWLAPSAGLVWFWPLAAAVLLWSGRHGAASAAIAAAYAAGTSLWWAPFGWVAWGDRLLYPVVVGAVFLCLLLRRPAVRIPWPIVALSTVTGIAAIATALDPGALAAFFAADARFPGPPTIQADVTLYRAFLRHLTWERWLDLRLVFTGAATAPGMAASVALVLAVGLVAPGAAGRGAGDRNPPRA